MELSPLQVDKLRHRTAAVGDKILTLWTKAHVRLIVVWLLLAALSLPARIHLGIQVGLRHKSAKADWHACVGVMMTYGWCAYRQTDEGCSIDRHKMQMGVKGDHSFTVQRGGKRI